MGVQARFDDLTSGTAVVLRNPIAVQQAVTLDQVRPLIGAAESAAREGHWVALMVAYEAGPAFDAAQRTASPSPDTPLAWFAAFPRADMLPAVQPGESVRVHDLERRGGWDWYGRHVGEVRDAIAAGDVYQVNLTDRLDGLLEGDALDLYARMAHAQRGPFNVFIDTGDLAVVSASPELFFDVHGPVVTTRPMKGTVARAPRSDDDRDAAAWLSASVKDRAENVMIVDLLRNDIGRVASVGSVTVPALLSLERYETVWQLTSTVQGEIAPSVRLVQLFDALFPCGSITGAPKVSAMQHIQRMEPWPRGIYCGAIGLIRPLVAGHIRPHATFNVAIRTAVVHSNGRLVYGAGGGITTDSCGDSENRELQAKSAVLMTDRPEFELLETIRVEAGVPLHLSLHLDRVQASAEWFGFAFRRDDARELLCSVTAEDHTEAGRLRLLVARDGTCTTTFDRMDSMPSVVTVVVADQPVRSDDVFTCHKTTHRAVYDRAAAAHPEADDVVLWNERGEVTETCKANVLFRIGAQWFTPPLSSGGLAGVGRQVLLLAGDVTERVLPVADLHRVDELQVVSALRGRRRVEWVTG
ncbi:MAG: aminodeoxychorismate synthase component I [Actinobacteria bacterium]|nr:aminodeoxychorismate synthase component I [Actinomycetota bacterium]